MKHPDFILEGIGFPSRVGQAVPRTAASLAGGLRHCEVTDSSPNDVKLGFIANSSAATITSHQKILIVIMLSPNDGTDPGTQFVLERV